MSRKSDLVVRSTFLTALMLIALSAGAMRSFAQGGSKRSAAELMDAVMWGREPIGGPFALIDHTGKPRTEQARPLT